MAKVIESLTSFLTAFTISAFCDGLTLQQITDRQFNDKNMKFSLMKGFSDGQQGRSRDNNKLENIVWESLSL